MAHSENQTLDVTVTLGEPDHTVASDAAVAGLKDVYEPDDGRRALARANVIC
jgi:hypothetical protein